MISKRMMVEKPKDVSHGLTLDMFEKNSVQISTKEEVPIFNPKSPLIWVDATVNAAAEQKPEITGADMNSTINPDNLVSKNMKYLLRASERASPVTLSDAKNARRDEPI